MKELVSKYQSHSHTFTCAKKGKVITIKENEGHGRLDGITKGPELRNIPICRFKFPKFPLDETRLVFGMPKDIDDNEVKTRIKDLNKIIKFLIRQTYVENSTKLQDQDMDFYEFLYSVGMFADEKRFADYSDVEKQNAKLRYLKDFHLKVDQETNLVLQLNPRK